MNVQRTLDALVLEHRSHTMIDVLASAIVHSHAKSIGGPLYTPEEDAVITIANAIAAHDADEDDCDTCADGSCGAHE